LKEDSKVDINLGKKEEY